MSEFCMSSAAKTNFSSLLMSDFMLFCSFILSHPLYFSYFIFFSPYLIKLLSFLSPLFITTSLLLLALLTGFPSLIHTDHHSPQSPESKVGFLLTTYNSVLERLRTKFDDENEGSHGHLEELEAYRIVFDTSSVLEAEWPSHGGGFGVGGSEGLTANLEENSPAEVDQPAAGGKSLEGFLQEKGEGESLAHVAEEGQEVKPPGADSNKVEERKEMSLMRSGSKAMESKVSEVSSDCGREDASKVMENSRRFGANFGNSDNGGENTWKVVENSQTVGANLGSFGSMRKEKEWKRTLACKLFEERHNVEGSEGMDMLWETYEADSSKVQRKSKTKKGKKGGVEYYEDEEEEEEEEVDGQLCCLQALKFSAGKMNLGMGRPNLMRISKALKGIGWLHHVTKHGRKGLQLK
ncbi:hypothetical protein L1049_004414 [Liquidambar formosana]|uniref:Uncharacterized protein n=1 Tax=Liquidambar formosana TaxID=63359 RepID=A0AAP0RNF5_LIQFO